MGKALKLMPGTDHSIACTSSCIYAYHRYMIHVQVYHGACACTPVHVHTIHDHIYTHIYIYTLIQNLEAPCLVLLASAGSLDEDPGGGRSPICIYI